MKSEKPFLSMFLKHVPTKLLVQTHLVNGRWGGVFVAIIDTQ